MRAAAMVVLCAVVALTGCGNSDSGDGDGVVEEVGTWPEGTPPCPQEDSPGPCYWDAATRSNGEGVSFWVDAQQTVHYPKP